MSTKKQNNDEELDLGSLFTVIGKGFRNFFNSIGNIFRGIFHRLIFVINLYITNNKYSIQSEFIIIIIIIIAVITFTYLTYTYNTTTYTILYTIHYTLYINTKYYILLYVLYICL